MTTTRESTVDTGGTGDYPSLDAWEDDFGGVGNSGDLVGEDEIALATCICTDGNADGTTCYVRGWISYDAGHYVDIVVDSDYRHDGTFPTSGNIYRMSVTGTYPIGARQYYVYITGLATEGLTGCSIDYGRFINLTDCVFRRNPDDGESSGYGILFNATAGTNYIRNCIVYDFKGVATAGVESTGGAGSTVHVQNCTIYNCSTGVEKTHGVMTPVNNIVFGCDDAFNNAMDSAENNCFDEGSDPGTGGTDISAYSATDVFEDPDNEDFHLAAGSPCIGVGKDMSASYTTDIDGETQEDPFDAGADKYVSYAEAYYRFENIRREFLHHRISKWTLGEMFDERRS